MACWSLPSIDADVLMPLVALVQGATAFNCGSSATLRRNIASGEVVFKRFYKV